MAKFWVTVLATAVAFGAFAGLFLPAPRAAAGDAPPRALGDPGSGWIPDVRVETNASAQRRPSMTTHANGDLLMAYQTNELGNEDVMFTRSRSGGLNWSTPVPVADTAANEVWPSTAADPESGRIFVAYQLGTVSPSTIVVAYSDDGAAWTQVIAFSCGVLCTRPRIAAEYWNGTSNRQYVVFDEEVAAGNRDLGFLRSEDQGVSWALMYESGLGATDVRHQPDIAVYRGTDGTDRVAVFYRYGFAFPGNQGNMEWSDDHGSTWQGPSGWAVNVDTPPVIAASHDGDSVLVAFNTAANDIWWAADQTPTDLTWGGGTYAGAWLGAGNNLAIAVDGTGAAGVGVGGSYHLFARNVVGLDIIHMSAPVSVTDQTNWAAIEVVSDTAGSPSATWPDKAATAVFRGGAWWPAVAWTDFRLGVANYELYFTTPGTLVRYAVDTNPGLLEVVVDGAVATAPVFGTWLSNTTHTVAVVSPQSAGAGARYSWINWTDGGAQSHTIVTGVTDVTLTANFRVEYQLTLTSARGGVTGAGWYRSMETATIAASSPQAGPPGERYVFLAWTGGLFSDQATAYVVMNGPKTVNAAWDTEYRLTVTSAYGTVTQTEPDGWYTDGDVATITLESVEVTEGGKTWEFLGWAGDATGTAANVTVGMDGPKNVTAEWREKPSLPSGSTDIVVILLVLVVVLVLILAIVAMRRRKRPQLQFQQMHPSSGYGTVPPPTEGAPPQGWPPQPPPTPPPP